MKKVFSKISQKYSKKSYKDILVREGFPRKLPKKLFQVSQKKYHMKRLRTLEGIPEKKKLGESQEKLQGEYQEEFLEGFSENNLPQKILKNQMKLHGKFGANILMNLNIRNEEYLFLVEFLNESLRKYQMEFKKGNPANFKKEFLNKTQGSKTLTSLV